MRVSAVRVRYGYIDHHTEREGYRSIAEIERLEVFRARRVKVSLTRGFFSF